jgi:hypothetical protein
MIFLSGQFREVVAHQSTNEIFNPNEVNNLDDATPQSPSDPEWIIECVDCPKQFALETNISLQVNSANHPHVAYGQNNLYYAWHDGITWHYEVADASLNVGRYPSLVLDTLSQPHISYYDSEIGALKYAYRDTSGWHNEIVDDAGDVGKDTSIDLDATGYPHISYYDRDNERLKYAYKAADGWHIDVLDDSGSVGEYSSLMLDEQGEFHISYYDRTNGGLKYACRKDNVRQIQTIDADGDVGRYTSLTLNNAGFPHISYHDATNVDLKYIYLDASGWHSETVDAQGKTGEYTAIALDNEGCIHISYKQADRDALMYASKCGDAWDIQAIASQLYAYTAVDTDASELPHVIYIANDRLQYTRQAIDGWKNVETVDWQGRVGEYTSLAIGPSGNLHASYYDNAHQDLKYIRRDLEGWHINTVDGKGEMVGKYSSLAVSQQGIPHIAYYNAGRHNLKYAIQTTSADWQIETPLIDGNHDIGQYVSLAIDSQGFPHLSYYDNTLDDLMYAYKNTTGWYTQTVDSTEKTGRYTSLVLDTNDHPCIAYYDVSHQDLKFACDKGSGWVVETVDTPGDVGRWASLALDKTGFAHISYYKFDSTNPSNSQLKYAHETAIGWQFEVVDSSGDIGGYTSIALDNADHPHISYYDWTNGDLRYAYKDGDGWHIHTIDNEGDVGKYTFLAIDNNNYPYISYHDESGKDLKIAYYLEACTPITNITIQGPASGNVEDASLTFSTTVTPSNATLPIEYQWSPGNLVNAYPSGRAAYTWSHIGSHEIEATAKNCGGLATAKWSVDIHAAPPKAPTLPSIPRPDAGDYLIAWEDIVGAKSYTLEEDDNPSFTSPITLYIGSNSYYSVTEKAEGTWYYRVRASNEGGVGPWSQLQAVVVHEHMQFTTPSKFVLETQPVLLLASIRIPNRPLPSSGEVVAKSGGQTFTLYDDGRHSDGVSGDGLYGSTDLIANSGNSIVELWVEGEKKDTLNLEIQEKPKVLILTNWEALYNEFRDTGMEVEDFREDLNQNGYHDFYDLVVRLNEYANSHSGIVVDLPSAISGYKGSNYGQGDTSTRLRMGYLIDKYIAQESSKSGNSIQYIVLFGDDEVVPFYRVFDPIDYYNHFGGTEPYQSKEREYSDNFGGTQGNPTLIDSSEGYIMSDVPYSIRQSQHITKDSWLSEDPDLPETLATPNPDMGVGRIFSLRPNDLISALDRYEKPIKLDPNEAKTALFIAEDPENRIDFFKLVNRSLLPQLTNWFQERLNIYNHFDSPWDPFELTAEFENNDLIGWWGHSNHISLQMDDEKYILSQDLNNLEVLHPVMFTAYGCHAGYSVSHYPNYPQVSSVYVDAWIPYLLSQGITHFAPSNQTATWPTTDSPHLQELMIAYFVNGMLEYANNTVGDVWKNMFPHYHTDDPRFADPRLPSATRIFHVASAYGNIFYGLPTQPVAREANSPLNTHHTDQSSTAPYELYSDTTKTLTFNIETPEFQKENTNKGDIISFPNEGTHIASLGGPILPLAVRSFVFPDGATSFQVSMTTLEVSNLSDIELNRMQFETSDGEIISNSYNLTNFYPKDPYTFTLTSNDEGNLLLLSYIPITYDPSPPSVTWRERTQFVITYTQQDIGIGPRLSDVIVNAGYALETDDDQQRVEGIVTYNGSDKFLLKWTVRALDGFVIDSGSYPIQALNGKFHFNLNTKGWIPGHKDLAIYLVKDGKITSSENIPLWVEGIGIHDLNADTRPTIYPKEVQTATWHIAIRDEYGELQDNQNGSMLIDRISVEVNGEAWNADITSLGNGEYQVDIPLQDIRGKFNTIKISAEDHRGLTGSREWAIIRRYFDVYLPIVMRNFAVAQK